MSWVGSLVTQAFHPPFSTTLLIKVVKLSREKFMGSALLVVHLWSCIMQEPQHLTRLLLSSLTFKYRDRLKGMQILLSRTQVGPGRTGKQEQ